MVAGWNPFLFLMHRFHKLHFPNPTGLFTKSNRPPLHYIPVLPGHWHTSSLLSYCSSQMSAHRFPGVSDSCHRPCKLRGVRVAGVWSRERERERCQSALWVWGVWRERERGREGERDKERGVLTLPLLKFLE
jgi:hypothetical protein